MDIFGIGPLNIIIILGVALVVFGPERLPEIAAKAGKFVRDLQAYASDMTGEFSGEFSEIRQHFEGVQEEMRSFGNEVRSQSADVSSAVRDVRNGLTDFGQNALSAPATGMNEPPPAQEQSGKVVPLTTTPIRPRVEDYKPGS